jgi:mono/diheme cytochrome c family protein
MNQKWFWLNTTFLVSAASVVAWMVYRGDHLSENHPLDVYPKLPVEKLADLEVVKGEVREGYDLSKLVAVSPEVIDQGKTVYSAQCAGCHGADGKGNPALGARNLTDPKTGWLNPATFAGMYKTLTEGVGKMPSYSTLPVEERAALIHYMMTLSGDYPKAGADDIAKLEAEYQLSQPKKSPNQVPVHVVMQKMAKEASKAEAKVAEPKDSVAAPAEAAAEVAAPAPSPEKAPANSEGHDAKH